MAKVLGVAGRDWPINYEPDMGDIESALYERGYIVVDEPGYIDRWPLTGQPGAEDARWVRESRLTVRLRCRFGDHPIDEDDEYGRQHVICRECDDERARDAYVDRLIDRRRGRGD